MGGILILTSYNTRWVGSTILAPKSTLLDLNANCSRPHVILWITFMLIYSVLLGLLPLTWISVIWDQIIDPEFDLEHIEQPESRIIKLFYKASAVINTNMAIRNICFVVIGIMTSLSAVLDLIIWTPCMLENPRVKEKNMSSFRIESQVLISLQNYT